MLQSLLTGKQTAKDLLATLDEVTRTKSMALLLRSFVAAYIQKELHDSGCKDEGYVLQVSGQISCTHNVPCISSDPDIEFHKVASSNQMMLSIRECSMPTLPCHYLCNTLLITFMCCLAVMAG